MGAFLLFTGGWRRSTGVTALLEQRKIDASAAYVEILPLRLQLEPGLSAVKDKAENFVAVDPNASGLSPWPRGLVFDMAKHDDQSSQLSRYCAEMTAIVDHSKGVQALRADPERTIMFTDTPIYHGDLRDVILGLHGYIPRYLALYIDIHINMEPYI